MNKTIFKVQMETTIDATTIMFVSKSEAEKKRITDMSGDAGTVFIQYEDKLTNVWIGTGEQDDNTNTYKSSICDGVQLAIAKCIDLKRDAVTVSVPKGFEDMVTLEVMNALYSFDEYKTEKVHRIKEIVFNYANPSKLYNNGMLVVGNAENISTAIRYTRNLQNLNASSVTPARLEESAEGIAKLNDKITVDTLMGHTLDKLDMGLLKAVGQASTVAPRMIVMKYVGNPDSDESLVLVGKGITYDSGGLSLKPSASMLGMKMDMSGSAIVLGVMKYLALDNPVGLNVTVIVPAAENAIGSKAYRVGDVISGYSGKTVEVQNTDAEGRLVLADALSYTVDKLNPIAIIDVATLTGAIVSALGDDIAGVFTNDRGRELMNTIKKSSTTTMEDVWEMPLTDTHRNGMKSKIADISNMSKNKGKCGASSAAAFLESFVGDTPWVHIDVAGTAMSDEVGGTGWGVKLLSDVVYSMM